ncbi:MAG: Ldh family oxidoreductase [Oscillospiraceae bacterium]|nr:Ldh family oxidoreductase [Oscillospiraceae bacterium]
MRFSVSCLKDYCEKLMTARGVDPDCAETVADMLLDAELTGVGTHGVSRLAIYLERVERGLVSRHNEAKILRESPSALAIDAGNSLGAVGAKFAMEACIRKARGTGCCFATVKNSNHFGAAAYYTRMAAAQGMIGFCCTNLTAKIAPHGAAEPCMGTNPISVAVPSGGFPVVLDMTPSVVALGKLILAQKLGKDIPLGWALDRDGKPTTDPAAGRAGSLIPIGGPKGSGLALMVEVLSGILSGAGTATHLHDLYEFDAPQGVGHFMGAIDVSKFLDLDAFRAGVDTMSDEIRGLKLAEGADEVLLPGERSARSAAEKAKTGIDVPEPVCAELNELGEAYGMKLEEA